MKTKIQHYRATYKITLSLVHGLSRLVFIKSYSHITPGDLEKQTKVNEK